MFLAAIFPYLIFIQSHFNSLLSYCAALIMLESTLPLLDCCPCSLTLAVSAISLLDWCCLPSVCLLHLDGIPFLLTTPWNLCFAHISGHAFGCRFFAAFTSSTFFIRVSLVPIVRQLCFAANASSPKLRCPFFPPMKSTTYVYHCFFLPFLQPRFLASL